MADLSDEFGPLAQWNKVLCNIHTIAIDVMGTAIDHNGKMYRNMIETATYLSHMHLNLMFQFISTQPMESEEALHAAHVRHPALKKGVMTKKDFYDQAEANGHNVLAFDDSDTQAERAALHLNPKNPEVQKYLETREYRQPHTPPPPEL